MAGSQGRTETASQAGDWPGSQTVATRFVRLWSSLTR